MQTRRERVRQAAIDEIKSTAWEIANEHGMEDVTVNGITRRMGMTPPAFYSYFKSRSELIKALVIDAYRSFRSALETARDDLPEDDMAGRFYHVYLAYREWAVTNPNLFGLFAGRMVHGIDPPDPDVRIEAELVYEIFSQLFNKAWEQDLLNIPQMYPNLPEELKSEIRQSLEQRNLTVPLEIANLILSGACLIHGMISMELSGRLKDLTGNPLLFYQAQILDLLHRFGIDYEPDEKQ